jgi:type II secretory pathway component PulJ
MLLRRALPYTSAALLAAIAYAGWTIYSRWQENRRAVQEAAAQKLELDQQTLKMIGTDLKILTFYANPSIHPGEKALICYGVANASSVSIEPAVEALWPSLSHCIPAAPLKTTEYTLTAGDAQGRSVSQKIVVKVQ